MSDLDFIGNISNQSLKLEYARDSRWKHIPIYHRHELSLIIAANQYLSSIYKRSCLEFFLVLPTKSFWLSSLRPGSWGLHAFRATSYGLLLNQDVPPDVVLWWLPDQSVIVAEEIPFALLLPASLWVLRFVDQGADCLALWHFLLPSSIPSTTSIWKGWDDVWQFKNLINLVAPERRVSTEENLRKPPPILLPSPPRLPGSPRPPWSPRPTSPPCSRPSLERLSCNRCPCR